MSRARRDMTYYWIAWGEVAVGLPPAVYFLWTWRPRHPWHARTLDAGAWVGVFALILAQGVYRLTTKKRHSVSEFDAVAGLVITAGIDALLWVRMLRWSNFAVIDLRGPLTADHPVDNSVDS